MRQLPFGTFFATMVATCLGALTATPARAQACAADALEPDDGCVAAATVIHGGETQNHDFCDDASDWVRFNACAGRSYTLETFALGAAADTVLELYGPDCTVLLAADDDGAGGLASRLTWPAPGDGVYHARIRQKDGTSGTSRVYGLGLTGDTSTCSTWTRSYTDSQFLNITYLRQIADGGYVVAGSTSTATEFGLLWVMSLDPSGDVRWQKRYGAPGEAFPAIQQAADGGFFVAERTRAFSVNPDESRAWVLRLDASGQIQWQKTYGGTSWDDAYEVCATTDGGFALAGSTMPGNDAVLWVLRGDAAGNVSWSYRYGSGSSIGRSIDQTADGGFIVGAELEDNATQNDFWIVKLDALGAVQWQTSIGGSEWEDLSLVRETQDGGYVAVGTAPFTPSTPVLYPNNAVWVVRLDGAGSILWQTSLFAALRGSFASNSRAPHVAEAPDHGFLVAHHISGGSTTNPWVFKLDASGNVVWQKKARVGVQAGGSYNAVDVTADGAFVLGGEISPGLGNLPAVVRKLDVNGEIASCEVHADPVSVVITSTATAAATNASRHAFAPTVTDTTITPVATAAATSSPCMCWLPAYTGVLSVSRTPPDPGAVLWSWTSAGSVTYDLVFGDIAQLRDTGGDFSAAVGCWANDTSQLSVAESFFPFAGTAWFYLLRTSSPPCVGTYNMADPTQVADRDDAIACP